MDNSIVNYIAAACGVLAAVVGMLTGRRGVDALGARSQRVYALSAVIAAAGLVAAMTFNDYDIFMLSVAVALLTLSAGMLRQYTEIHTASKLEGEQRVDVDSGLPNERLFEERLKAEHSRTKRTGQRYSIAVFEIDDFVELGKDDQIGGMRLLATALEESIRNTDTLGRIGGQQAAVLLVDTLTEGAMVGCDRACERFFFQSCGHSETANVTRPLTASVGIASFGDDIVDPNDVLENARAVLSRMRTKGETGIAVHNPAESIGGAQGLLSPED